MPKKKADLSGSFEIHPQLEHSIKLKQRKFKFTQKQQRFLDMVLDPQNPIIFVSGPAGSSKT
jgi:predicted ribonuclease YlaK